MIGGLGQRDGTEYAARNAACTPDGMEMNLEAAYDRAAGVKSLRRSFALGPEGLRLTDEGTLEAPREVTWVFLLRNRPEWQEGQITAGGLILRCPEGLTFSAEEKPVTDARMARNWPGSLWRVELKSGAADRFRAEFVFSAAGV